MAKKRAPVFHQLLSYYVNRTSDMLRRGAMMRFKREHDVSLMEWRTLVRIEAMQPVTLRELVENASTDKAQISRIVSGLVQAGWVDRTAHATDARSAILSLTQEGSQRARAITRSARARDKAFRSVLSEREIQQLAVIMDKLYAKGLELAETEEKLQTGD
jgi:DNA-binding MarR family transcriptional regulator